MEVHNPNYRLGYRDEEIQSEAAFRQDAEAAAGLIYAYFSDRDTLFVHKTIAVTVIVSRTEGCLNVGEWIHFPQLPDVTSVSSPT
ncbi:hypothetical protein E4U15_006498 [Claviceps sp. LM218 group G6]|nr:hypothetical protein E4U15_006498 [Claviceps sp. LM218 group G6]